MEWNSGWVFLSYWTTSRKINLPFFFNSLYISLIAASLFLTQQRTWVMMITSKELSSGRTLLASSMFPINILSMTRSGYCLRITSCSFWRRGFNSRVVTTEPFGRKDKLPSFAGPTSNIFSPWGREENNCLRTLFSILMNTLDNKMIIPP